MTYATNLTYLTFYLNGRKNSELKIVYEFAFTFVARSR